MSDVTLRIGGRSYAVACAAGEEKHVQALGDLIADKVDQMGGTHSEPRQLLFAALLLADELHELRERTAARPKPDPARLEALAQRLENCASALEGQARLL